MFSHVFIDIFPPGKGSRSRLRHFTLFVFCGFSWGALGTILALFWVPLGVSWGPLGRLGTSLVTLGGYFGYPLPHLRPPWPPLGCTLVAFVMNLGTLRSLEVHSGMVLADLG